MSGAPEHYIGSCNCKATTVKVIATALPSQSILCHCLNCRNGGGSLGSLNLVIPSENVEVEGHVTMYRDSNTVSGNTVIRSFCPTCGSPIRTVPENAKETSYVKAALFDTSIVPKAGVEIYRSRCADWEPAALDVKVVQ